MGEALPTQNTQMGSDHTPSDPTPLLANFLVKVTKMDLSFRTPQELRSFASIMITAAI